MSCIPMGAVDNMLSLDLGISFNVTWNGCLLLKCTLRICIREYVEEISFLTWVPSQKEGTGFLHLSMTLSWRDDVSLAESYYLFEILLLSSWPFL